MSSTETNESKDLNGKLYAEFVKMSRKYEGGKQPDKLQVSVQIKTGAFERHINMIGCATDKVPTLGRKTGISPFSQMSL